MFQLHIFSQLSVVCGWDSVGLHHCRSAWALCPLCSPLCNLYQVASSLPHLYWWGRKIGHIGRLGLRSEYQLRIWSSVCCQLFCFLWELSSIFARTGFHNELILDCSGYNYEYDKLNYIVYFMAITRNVHLKWK